MISFDRNITTKFGYSEKYFNTESNSNFTNDLIKFFISFSTPFSEETSSLLKKIYQLNRFQQVVHNVCKKLKIRTFRKNQLFIESIEIFNNGKNK